MKQANRSDLERYVVCGEKLSIFGRFDRGYCTSSDMESGTHALNYVALRSIQYISIGREVSLILRIEHGVQDATWIQGSIPIF